MEPSKYETEIWGSRISPPRTKVYEDMKRETLPVHPSFGVDKNHPYNVTEKTLQLLLPFNDTRFDWKRGLAVIIGFVPSGSAKRVWDGAKYDTYYSYYRVGEWIFQDEPKEEGDTPWI